MGQSNKPQTIGYRYFMGIHMSLCRGPINELREIRVGDRVAWRGSALGQARWLIAASSLFGGDEGEGGIYGTIDMMLGTETQPVNPRLKRMLGSALVPAFRGMTTLFFDGLISSMNPYPKPWAFRARRVTAGWDDDNVWYPEKALIWQGNDTITSMNPAHIIYEAFTNREWGRGRSAARMHDASFRAAADKLYAEGFGLCICWRRQDGLGALVKSVLDHIGGVLLDDLVTAQVSLYLIRDDYVVDDLPLFDEDSGLLGIDEDDAADGAMATNEVVVKFTNMMNDGADDQVRVQNNAAIQSVGAVLSETVQYPHIPTSGLAARLAQRDLASKSAAVRRFKVRLDRRGAEVLPGKAFCIRSLKRGYERLVLRAGQCDYGTLQAGTVTISAVIDAYGLPDTAYVAPQPPTVNPPTADPLPATVRRIFEITYRDLVHFLTPAQMAEVTDTSCAVGVIARRPSAAALAYTLLTRVGSASWGGVDTGDWCPTAQIATALDYLTTTTRITYGTDISTVQAGAPALIDDEIVRVVSLDIDTGDLVIARGCADTVPAKHAAGARIWFYESDTAVDPVDYAPGVTVQAKVQTRTSTGLLDLALAPVDSHLTVRRQARPYPPGNLRVNGASYPAEVIGEVSVSVSHRNRILQADQLVDTLQGDIGPEAGTEYRFRFYDGASLKREVIQAGTAFTYTGGDEILDGGPFNPLRIVVDAVRDGLGSYQAHDVTVGRVLDAVVMVASTDTVYAEAASQTKTIPGAAAPGDLLLAVVMHRSDLTPPSGWTLVRTASVAVSGGTGTHRLSIYSRSAEVGDGGTSTLWAQATSQRIAVVIQAYRRPGASASVVAHAGRTAADAPYTASAAAATANYQMAVVAITFNGAPSGAVTPPSGYLLSTPGSADNNRLGVARRLLSSGSASSGVFSASPTGASGTAYAQISVVIG